MTEQEDQDAMFAAACARLLEREAEHWEAEYEHLTMRYGSYRQSKIRAAWSLGASMLRRRAEQYRTGTVNYLQTPTQLAEEADPGLAERLEALRKTPTWVREGRERLASADAEQ